MQTSQRRRK